MKIIDLMATDDPFLSLEFFPPKEQAARPGFEKQLEGLAQLSPLFVSVTYGAGGGSRANTLGAAARMKERFGFTSMAHLTCIGATEDSITAFVRELRSAGIKNILALRGDLPQGAKLPDNPAFSYASDLMEFIAARWPDMGLAAACYPEAHPESATIVEDLEWTRRKFNSGADFGLTQLFFDARRYHDFTARLRQMGVTNPIIPGVLPLLNMRSLHRILSLCGASIPVNMYLELREAEKQGGPEAVKSKGIEMAQNQIRELLENGAPGIHLYTLNNAEACLRIMKGVPELRA